MHRLLCYGLPDAVWPDKMVQLAVHVLRYDWRHLKHTVLYLCLRQGAIARIMKNLITHALSSIVEVAVVLLIASRGRDVLSSIVKVAVVFLWTARVSALLMELDRYGYIYF